MATSDERREVAERLRNLTIGHQIRYAEQFFDELADAVIDFEGYHDFNAVLEELADLIDRPMCRDLVEHKQDPFVPGKRTADGFFHCSACGWHGRIYEYVGFGDMMSYEAVCCPKCDARVVSR